MQAANPSSQQGHVRGTWQQQTTMWEVDTTQREDDSVAQIVSPKTWLRWVFPPDRESIRLEHGLIIGRDPECGVPLSGDGVSRRHLQVYRQGPIFALKDLGSTNGSFLDGRRIAHAPVTPGAVLRVGDHVGIFVECVGSPSEFSEIAQGLLGGQELQTALGAVARAATSNLSIVIIGGTGTGKERVARAVHQLSGRKGPFHAINCAALPKSLAEGELFGYRKGAFTGAERASIGHFRAADRGTLFLDEIAELPLTLQSKLLRVLEEHTVTPLGETEAIPIDVRVIAASQRPLPDSVAAREFRDDLMARLDGLTVMLPALRDRPADIAPLFHCFVTNYSGGRPPEIDVKLIECLCLHQWPGNVRELEQLARRLLAVHGGEPLLKRSFLPEGLVSRLPQGSVSRPPQDGPLSERREYDVRRLAQALKRTAGNVAAAAALVGFSRQRAYRLLEGQNATEFMVGQEAAAGDHEV
jgi:sigma-54 dependent transcriptional regulator, acetoin dehydrogenase operon transcriptional activator AcoR